MGCGWGATAEVGGVMVLLASVLAGVAVGLAVPGRGATQLARLASVPAAPRRLRGPVFGAVIAGVIASVAFGVGGLYALGWTIAGLAVAATVIGLVWRGVGQRRARIASREVARAARMLAGQLRIGQVPAVALADAASDCPVLARAAMAAQVGGDVVMALSASAARPGCAGLVEVAAAWRLSEASGAPIADIIERTAQGLRERESAEAAVAIEIAGARTTGRVMAVLPLAGLGLGYASGSDPVRFLTAEPLGEALFVVGVLLAVAGVWWMERMADRAAG